MMATYQAVADGGLYQRLWKGRRGGLRLLMLLAMGALLAMGLMTLIMAGHYLAELGVLTNPYYFFMKQGQWIVLGMLVMVAVNLVHYRRLGQWSYALFGLNLVLLAVVLAGKLLDHPLLNQFVPMINGAHRWIKPMGGFGPDIKVQPSEPAKLTFILALAWYLRHGSHYRSLRGLCVPFGISLLPVVLILLEPDLGTALLFLPVLFAMLFMAGAKGRHLLLILAMGIVMIPIFWFTPNLMHSYQKNRIRVLLKQNTDDPYWLRGHGYQLHRSKLCLGSGRVSGQGFKESLFVRNRHLPEGHNDFIFALIGHQWGFVGASVVLLLFFLMAIGGLEIASEQIDPFGRLAAVGITALIFAQVFINAGMTMGLTPITGMNLPFVSYGGSSMLVNFAMVGVLINIARHRPPHIAKKPFEYDDEA